MKILITADNEFTGDALTVGRYYLVEPADTGTHAQNATFHALLDIFWRSGCHSYDAGSLEEFKKYIKKDLGSGYESYVYIEDTGNGLIKGNAKSFSDIPKNVGIDKNGKKMIWGILKSWSDYSKKERLDTIDRLIVAMVNSGVNSKRFHEVLEGMESRQAG